MFKYITLLGTVTFFVAYAFADEVKVKISLLEPKGTKPIGSVVMKDTTYGLLITPNLRDVPPGLHGFHVHETPSCASKTKDKEVILGGGAGGHYDPQNTKQHLGPYGEGHLGDLPPLYADKKGNVTVPVLAPRLKVKDVKKRSVMIHMDGDNFSDKPQKLGGGGPRLACGVVN